MIKKKKIELRSMIRHSYSYVWWIICVYIWLVGTIYNSATFSFETRCTPNHTKFIGSLNNAKYINSLSCDKTWANAMKFRFVWESWKPAVLSFCLITKCLLVFHVAESMTSRVHIQKYSLVQIGISLCPLFCLEDPNHA